VCLLPGLADVLCLEPLAADELVDDRALADARRPDEAVGPCGQEHPLEVVDALARDVAQGQDRRRDAGFPYSGHLGGEDVRLDQVRLGEKYAGSGSAVLHHDEIPLEPVEVEVVVAGLHDDHVVDVGRDHLVIDGVPGRPSAQGGPPLEKGADQAEVVGGLSLDADPVAHARELLR